LDISIIRHVKVVKNRGGFKAEEVWSALGINRKHIITALNSPMKEEE
jgi:hypothetical protein